MGDPLTPEEAISRIMAEKDFKTQVLTKRQYLTRRALEAGADLWTAIEAVASTGIEHPEWDMEEEKTREEWDADE